MDKTTVDAILSYTAGIIIGICIVIIWQTYNKKHTYEEGLVGTIRCEKFAEVDDILTTMGYSSFTIIDNHGTYVWTKRGKSK